MNILVTGAWQCTEEQLDVIRSAGHSVIFMQYEKNVLPCEYERVDGVICNGLFFYHPIEKFVNLKYIQLTSAGYDRVPMEYIKKHGIAIYNARGVYSVPMAEFAISGVLQLYKQSRFFYGNQKEHRWEKHRGLAELFGKNVLIVGCGSVGTECAKRFSAFGCDITGVDIQPREDEYYEKIVKLEELDEMMPEADVIILTLPLSEDTHHLFGHERLAKMKNTAVLVNISRGAVVNTKAFIDILPNIGGAVLDVFEEEPLGEQSPLWNMENVIITPHNSFVGEGNGERLADTILNNIREY